MKKVLGIMFLAIGFVTKAQKVVKPAGNEKDTFSLTINKVYYKDYIAAFVQKPVYKQLWLDMIEKMPIEKRSSLKGTELSATIKLLISSMHDGKVYVENHYSVSSDTSIVSENDIEKIAGRIKIDLRKEIKSKGVVTPAYSTYHKSYVNDETVVEHTWTTKL